MYLKNLQIKNFRCIEELFLEFDEGVNVIIGENNTGKTGVIDVLRLVFSIGSQRREIFLSPDDFFIDRFGKRTNAIEFHLTFSGVKEEEQGLFIEMLSINDSGEAELKLHICYTLEHKKGLEKIKFRYWGGENEGQAIPPEVMDLFYFVYLGALRDANQDLSPRRGNRLGELFVNLVRDTNKQEELAKSINEKISEDSNWKSWIDKAKEKINRHLEKASISNDIQTVEIDFVPMEFKKIAETLRMFNPFKGVVRKDEVILVFKEEDDSWKKYFEDPNKEELVPKDDFQLDSEMNDEKKRFLEDVYRESHKLFEISRNGLGYNNLLYIATVLGDLWERKSIERETYAVLLIEEPEAHLHPQLQDILFNYFRQMGKGQIQIFITSHSPTITAKTDIDSTMVLYREKGKISNLPLRKCPLESKHKKYLERFLDVTKSQLFFAKGVILVEGISEALLLPVFAEIMGEDYNLDKNGIEVVNIGGVAFEPFAVLFNSDDEKKRLNVRCAIVTDDDRNGEKISSRAQKAKDLEGGKLKVFPGEHTFEYQLIVSGNEEMVISTYQEMHPHTNLNFDDGTKDRAKKFVDKLNENRDKAEFAQLLGIRLQEDVNLRENFKVPPYIEKAIRWVVGNDD